jgi:hypothetical protein
MAPRPDIEFELTVAAFPVLEIMVEITPIAPAGGIAAM